MPARDERKPQARSQATQARIVALDALLDVAKSGAFAALALDQRMSRVELSDLDKRFCTEIFYGTIEKRLYLDWALSQVLEEVTTEPVAREVLRMTAYQLIFMNRVPETAACSQAAELLREKKTEGLLPAVFGASKNLARLVESGLPEVTGTPEEVLSLTSSTPLWLVRRLADAYGLQGAEDFLTYHPVKGQMAVHINPSLVFDSRREETLNATGLAWRPGAVTDSYIVQGDAVRCPAFFDGLWTVQSEASQLVARLVGAKRGQRILDACAAPGGKAAYMAGQMQGTGRVIAWDIHPHRVQLISQTAGRLHLENIRAVVQDASMLKTDMIGTMDAVLVDAPCSGIGVLHEKPDLRYRLQESAIAEMALQQLSILSACCQYVRPGGTFVYATCTVLPQENRDVAAAFLAAHPEFCADWTGLPDAFRPHAAPDGLQLWPQRDGVEGFFVLRMVKRP